MKLIATILVLFLAAPLAAQDCNPEDAACLTWKIRALDAQFQARLQVYIKRDKKLQLWKSEMDKARQQLETLQKEKEQPAESEE